MRTWLSGSLASTCVNNVPLLAPSKALCWYTSSRKAGLSLMSVTNTSRAAVAEREGEPESVATTSSAYGTERVALSSALFVTSPESGSMMKGTGVGDWIR